MLVPSLPPRLSRVPENGRCPRRAVQPPSIPRSREIGGGSASCAPCRKGDPRSHLSEGATTGARDRSRAMVGLAISRAPNPSRIERYAVGRQPKSPFWCPHAPAGRSLTKVREEGPPSVPGGTEGGSFPGQGVIAALLGHSSGASRLVPGSAHADLDGHTAHRFQRGDRPLVDVLHEGAWYPGELRSWDQGDDGSWSDMAEWTVSPGSTYLGRYHQSSFAPTASGDLTRDER